MKTGLVLEGGALRTVYSCGVCDALLDSELPMPDYTIGVSAGIAYGCSYLSKQSRRNLKLICAYARDRRYMGFRNLINPHNRAYFGMDFAYNQIPNYLVPYDYNAFEQYPGAAEAVVTNIKTGQAEYLPVPRRDPDNIILRATCAIPVMFPAITINGEKYLDGGCSDPIPWKRAFDMGCDRVIIILTRERDYYKKNTRDIPVEMAYRRYPEFLNTMRRRAEQYNSCREELFQREQEQKGDILIIAPEDTMGCSRTERNLKILRALWQEGYFDALRLKDKIQAFWSE